MVAFRQHLLATAATVALIGGASAADLPVKAPPQIAAAPWSWAGFYVGVNVGVASNRARFTDIGDLSPPPGLRFAFVDVTTFWSPQKSGFAGGGQAGYNFQSGRFVYGLEADINFVNSSATAIIPAILVPDLTASTKLDSMATVRGRAGVTMLPTLLYVTGGLALARFRDLWFPTNNPAARFVSNSTRSGWTAGGGIEHMFARNWTGKIEALYADFGNWTVQGPPGVVGNYRSRFAHEVVTVRGGLNYKW